MLFEYVEAHNDTNSYRADDKHGYRVLRFVCIGTTPSAAFVDASDLVGDAKRLRLPRFDGYLNISDDLESPSLCLILHPVVNPPPQNSISPLTIKHSANASCCIAVSTAPLVPFVHVQHSPPCFNYYIFVYIYMALLLADGVLRVGDEFTSESCESNGQLTKVSDKIVLKHLLYIAI